MPENWKTYRLENIAKISGGKRMPKGQNLVEYETGHPYIRVRDMNTRTIRKSDLLYVPDPAFDKISRYIVEENDIIISVVGTIGNIAIIDKNISGANLTENCNKITELQNLDSSFLYYYLISNIGQHEIAKGVVGSTQPKLPLYSIKDINLNLPPFAEQRAIANILSALDDKIENNLAMNKTLEDMAMALYKHWFVDSGGKFENTLNDYVHLNPRLSIKKGEVATYVNMKALPTEGMSVSEVDKVVVKGGAKYQNGDTLLARITPCLENGKTAFVDFLTQDEIGFGSTEFLVLRAKDGISKYWVYCLSRDINLVNHAVSCMIGTSGRQRVQNDPFLQYELPETDANLMKKFEIKVEPWFKKVKTNTTENQTLIQLRDTLLPKLISGEVRLREFELQLAKVI